MLWWLACAAPAPEPAPVVAPEPAPLQQVGWIAPEPPLVSVLGPSERLDVALCFLGGDWRCAEAWVEIMEPACVVRSHHAAFFGLLAVAPESPQVPLRQLVALDRAAAGLHHPDPQGLPLCSTDCRDLLDAYLKSVPVPRPGLAAAPALLEGRAPQPRPAPYGALVPAVTPEGARWAWSLPVGASAQGVVVADDLLLALVDGQVVGVDLQAGHVRFVRDLEGPVHRGGMARTPEHVAEVDGQPVVATHDGGIRLDPRTGVPLGLGPRPERPQAPDGLLARGSRHEIRLVEGDPPRLVAHEP